MQLVFFRRRTARFIECFSLLQFNSPAFLPIAVSDSSLPCAIEFTQESNEVEMRRSKVVESIVNKSDNTFIVFEFDCL